MTEFKYQTLLLQAVASNIIDIKLATFLLNQNLTF